MNKIIGYCRFCGNPRMVMANDEMTDEDLNNQAFYNIWKELHAKVQRDGSFRANIHAYT